MHIVEQYFIYSNFKSSATNFHCLFSSVIFIYNKSSVDAQILVVYFYAKFVQKVYKTSFVEILLRELLFETLSFIKMELKKLEREQKRFLYKRERSTTEWNKKPELNRKYSLTLKGKGLCFRNLVICREM